MDTPEHEGVTKENEEVGRFRTETGYEIVLTSVPRLGDGLLMTVFMMENKEPVKWEIYLDKDILSNLSGAFLGQVMTAAFTPLTDSLERMVVELEKDEGPND